MCLEFQIDGNLLDVNVHPTKMEIRFSNQNLVYDLVERTVKDALSGKELIPEVTLDTPGAKTHSNADIRVEIADEHIWYAGTAVSAPITRTESHSGRGQ